MNRKSRWRRVRQEALSLVPLIPIFETSSVKVVPNSETGLLPDPRGSILVEYVASYVRGLGIPIGCEAENGWYLPHEHMTLRCECGAAMGLDDAVPSGCPKESWCLIEKLRNPKDLQLIFAIESASCRVSPKKKQ